jgi:hypothetical protein
MSSVRRFQAPVIAVLVMLLATPAVAACCAWTTEPMRCCEKSDDAGLAAPCCMSQADAPQRPLPASTAKVSRIDAGLSISTASLPPNVVAVALFGSASEPFNGPPATGRLYLRLSVIRR